jgi:hypothetical protein
MDLSIQLKYYLVLNHYEHILVSEELIFFLSIGDTYLKI